MLPREIIAYVIIVVLLAGAAALLLRWRFQSPRRRFLRQKADRKKLKQAIARQRKDTPGVNLRPQDD